MKRKRNREELLSENKRKLVKKIWKLSDDHFDCDLIYLLNKYSKIYDIKWLSKDDEESIIYYTYDFNDFAKKQMEADFMFLLMRMIEVVHSTDIDKIYCNVTTEEPDIFSFICIKKIYSLSEEGLVECSCGNVWDGNAQCMCCLLSQESEESEP